MPILFLHTFVIFATCAPRHSTLDNTTTRLPHRRRCASLAPRRVRARPEVLRSSAPARPSNVSAAAAALHTRSSPAARGQIVFFITAVEVWWIMLSRRPMTVKTPPMIAHEDVMNLYAGTRSCWISIEIGLRSYLQGMMGRG